MRPQAASSQLGVCQVVLTTEKGEGQGGQTDRKGPAESRQGRLLGLSQGTGAACLGWEECAPLPLCLSSLPLQGEQGAWKRLCQQDGDPTAPGGFRRGDRGADARADEEAFPPGSDFAPSPVGPPKTV